MVPKGHFSIPHLINLIAFGFGLVGLEGGARFEAEPVGNLAVEDGQRAQQIVRQPAGDLRPALIFPQAQRSLQAFYKANQAGDALILGAGPNKSAQVEQQGQVETRIEGGKAMGGFGPQLARHLIAQGIFFTSLAA